MAIGGHTGTHDWIHSPTGHFEAHTRKVNLITTHSSTVKQLFLCSMLIAGADLDEGAGNLHPQGFDPLPTQNGAHFGTFLRYPFVADQIYKFFFLKAPLESPYINFEGGAARRKTQFLVKNLKRLFINSHAVHKIWSNRAFIVIWESSENTFGRLRRRSTKSLKIW